MGEVSRIHVYLDDFRECPKGFILAQNVQECKTLIDESSIDILSLDFDLGWGQPTGYEVVRHMVECGRYPQKIYLHTSSIAGRMQMYDLLMTSIPEHTELINGPMPQTLLDQIALS